MITSSKTVLPENIEEGDVLDLSSGDFDVEPEETIENLFTVEEIDSTEEEFVLTNEDGAKAIIPFGYSVQVIIE